MASGFRRPAGTAFGIRLSLAAADKDDGGLAPPHPAGDGERAALAEARRRLPVAAHHDEILYLVETHATTVLVGETGCGKTTQAGCKMGWWAGDWGGTGKGWACGDDRLPSADPPADFPTNPLFFRS